MTKALGSRFAAPDGWRTCPLAGTRRPAVAHPPPTRRDLTPGAWPARGGAAVLRYRDFPFWTNFDDSSRSAIFYFWIPTEAQSILTD